MSQFTQVHTSKKYRPYTVKKDVAGNEYVYLSGASNIAVGTWVNMDVGVDGSATILDTDTADSMFGRVAVAMAAVDSTSKYGWFQISGAASGLALTGSTDAKPAYATSTGGSVDDSGAGAETLIFGAWSTGAVTSGGGLQAFALNRPFMIGVTND